MNFVKTLSALLTLLPRVSLSNSIISSFFWDALPFLDDVLTTLDVLTLKSEKLFIYITEDTCDKSGMFDIPYGKGKSLMHGAVFK